MKHTPKPALFRCLQTGELVQHLLSEANAGANVFEPVTCPICNRIHLINQATGQALGEHKLPHMNTPSADVTKIVRRDPR